MNLADNLKKIRKDNNISQEQLAEKLGVSRQSVSKWESGVSYPEMDKVLQLCKLFNLNINELLNENIKEVEERKDEQNRTNKYINSFFDYITKVVDVITSMKFKDKFKCFFEQCFIIFSLYLIFLIVGLVGHEIIRPLLDILPQTIHYFIFNLIEALYLIITIIVGIAILLHIFKIRYLDYYEISKEDSLDENNENIINDNNKKDKIILEKKKEKIVIRYPKHSEYKFFNGLGKIILLFIKSVVAFILLGFSLSLIILVVFLPLCFLVLKSGLLFIGLILSLLGFILINIIIVELLYDFIVNRKWNKFKIFIIFITSLIVIGLGIGIICI